MDLVIIERKITQAVNSFFFFYLLISHLVNEYS